MADCYNVTPARAIRQHHQVRPMGDQNLRWHLAETPNHPADLRLGALGRRAKAAFGAEIEGA